MTGEEIGQWAESSFRELEESHGFVEFGESDFAAFDASVCGSALMFLLALYKWLGAPKALVEIFKRRTKKKANIAGANVKFLGQVSSGDGDTSVGDFLIQTVIYMLWYMSIGLYWKRKVRLVELGDDGFSLVSGRRGRDPAEFMQSYGFNIEIEWTTDLAHTGFLSSVFYPTTDGWVLGPKIGRFFGKTLMEIGSIPEREYLGRLKGIARSLENCTYIPVMGAWIEWVLENVSAKAISRFEHADKPRVRPAETHERSESLYEFLARRYDCSPQDLHDLEAEVMEHPVEPYVIDSAVTRIIIEKDWGPE
jgi:hypothetical protein